MPIFRVKSVKKFTPAKKNLHGYTRGARDKYEVCFQVLEITHTLEMCGKENMTLFIFSRAPIFMDIVGECKMKEFKEWLVSFETT